MPKSLAKNTETVVKPLDCVIAMPKLHIANTTACGLLKCGILRETIPTQLFRLGCIFIEIMHCDRDIFYFIKNLPLKDP
jgi:hypothetical protein